jgi:hypothetical protein
VEPVGDGIEGQRVREPGEAVVGVPGDRKEQDDLSSAGEVRFYCEESRELCEGEDEDEVEEELESRNAHSCVRRFRLDDVGRCGRRGNAPCA